MKPNSGTITKKSKSITNQVAPTLLNLTLMTAVLTTQAQESRFYVKADAGGSSARDVQLREFFGQAIAPNAEISLDSGIRLGIRGGYGLTDWLDTEIETGITANSIDSITGAAVSDGSLANIPLLFNLRLHTPEQYRLSAYFGGGVGFASTVLSGDDLVIGGTKFDGTAAGAVFAYQGFVGLRFTITDRLGVSLEYHYLRAEASSMSADLTVGATSDRVKLGRTETHSISAGVDFRF